MTIFYREHLKAEGYVIDDCCYPPLAYKGARLIPTSSMSILTELEEAMYLWIQDQRYNKHMLKVLDDKMKSLYKEKF
jgi:hypothetical protein